MPDSFARFFSNRRVLVIAPHADDESVGCGGTIARATDAGAAVYLLVVSVGDLIKVDGKQATVAGTTRRTELERVAQYLDVNDFELLRRPARLALPLRAGQRRLPRAPGHTVRRRMSDRRIRQIMFRNQLLFTWKNVSDWRILASSARTALWHLRRCHRAGEGWRARAIAEALLRLPAALLRRRDCAKGRPDREVCPLVYE